MFCLERSHSGSSVRLLGKQSISSNGTAGSNPALSAETIYYRINLYSRDNGATRVVANIKNKYMILENKIAIVTGARRGIGKGIALALAKEGCNIVVSDIDQKDCELVTQEIQGMGVKALAVQCDVSKKSDIEKLFQEAVKAFNHVDILVNNAGIFPFVPFKDMQESDWDKVLDINLKSVF